MLNPDGVIVGNYRCSLAGVDLNRTFKNTVRDLYPTIYNIKVRVPRFPLPLAVQRRHLAPLSQPACRFPQLMMQRLARDREVVVYCDLHGHSRLHNVFVYGCHNKTTPSRLLLEQVFPMIMSLNGPSHFSFKSSKFSVKRSKEATGRVVTWRELVRPSKAGRRPRVWRGLRSRRL